MFTIVQAKHENSGAKNKLLSPFPLLRCFRTLNERFLLSMMTLLFRNTDNQSVVGSAQNRVTDSAEEQRMPIGRERKEGLGNHLC